ncbi:polysaccharide deacetylase family protein [Thermoguttaceae bacterium LCP21S3_D4]|nr:polysaccharide deacetylase family protein [Lachnospiraceae bacterium]
MSLIRKVLMWMNLALAVLVIAAGACRIRVNHLASAESMNTKETGGVKEPSNLAEEDETEHIKEVALTFDDGPSPECTKDLLEGLKERNVKATFFVIGEKAEAYPDLIKKIKDDGHIIGNHSYTHVNLGILSKEDACEQVRKTNDVIYQITGEYPQFLRSPFGSTQKNLDCQMNMIEVLWDVDPRDWEVQNKEKVVNKVMTDVKDGDIILLHDGYDSSMLAAFEIIDRLQAQGYEFVTVDKLIFELP